MKSGDRTRPLDLFSGVWVRPLQINDRHGMRRCNELVSVGGGSDLVGTPATYLY
jgi:hypothetical protein